VGGVRLYHDQALYKEAGGGPTPWHADQYYWPLTTDRVVTAWVPLQAVSADMGPLAFAERTHSQVEFPPHSVSWVNTIEGVHACCLGFGRASGILRLSRPVSSVSCDGAERIYFAV
jgi:Phytanoyl-CoA dioxygenase (PhyH)